MGLNFLYTPYYIYKPPLRREAGDVVTGGLGVDNFCTTIVLDIFQRSVLARENVVDGALASYVLYLTA